MGKNQRRILLAQENTSWWQEAAQLHFDHAIHGRKFGFEFTPGVTVSDSPQRIA